MLRASALGLIFSMRLADRKDIQSVKSAWSILHSKLKGHIWPPLDRNNNKWYKMNRNSKKSKQHSSNTVTLKKKYSISFPGNLLSDFICLSYVSFHPTSQEMEMLGWCLTGSWVEIACLPLVGYPCIDVTAKTSHVVDNCTTYPCTLSL